MKIFLDGFLPRIFPSLDYTLIAHEGKSDLERSVPRKLRAWRDRNVRFVVMRDQDAADCRLIRQRLVDLCVDGGNPHALVRVVCRELEAWYLGDLTAVEAAYCLPGLGAKQAQAKFRNPDRLHGPSRELTVLVPGFAKTDGARRLGPLLEPARCRSASLQAFVAGVSRLIAEASDSER